MLCCGCSLNNHGKPQVLLWIRFVDRKENQPSFTGCPVKIFKKNEKKKDIFLEKMTKKDKKRKKMKIKWHYHKLHSISVRRMFSIISVYFPI